jgi:hypothetical protein
MEITNIPCEKSVFLSPYECDFYKSSTPELGAPHCFTMEPLDITPSEMQQFPLFDWPDATLTQQSTPASSVDETFTDEALFFMEYPYLETGLAPELSWLPLDDQNIELEGLPKIHAYGCPQPPG